MISLGIVFGALTLVSLGLTVWQLIVAWRFPIHRRIADTSFTPAVTLLKPLKGCDPTTKECLRSWLEQDYPGQMQVLFGVASADDPVCDIVRELIAEHTARNVELVICRQELGVNAKVSKLSQLLAHARHDILVISDADVRVAPDLLANVVAPLRDRSVGLVNCLYRLANPSTLAMRWEAVSVNADFWSQVLQNQSLRQIDFALGAVMATTRLRLEEIGGFAALADYLADDFWLGNLIAKRGGRIVICTVVVDCILPPSGWREVWKHQTRWARTIRVCRPAPYALSILSNATLWPLLWLLAQPEGIVLAVALVCAAARMLSALALQRRLTNSWEHLQYAWLAPARDLLQFVIWALAFSGSDVEWRGQRYTVRRNGKLVKR